MNDSRCCHDINHEDNTVRMFKRKFMTTPNVYFGVCVICGKSIKYVKDGDGNYNVLEEEDACDENLRSDIQSVK